MDRPHVAKAAPAVVWAFILTGGLFSILFGALLFWEWRMRGDGRGAPQGAVVFFWVLFLSALALAVLGALVRKNLRLRIDAQGLHRRSLWGNEVHVSPLDVRLVFAIAEQDMTAAQWWGQLFLGFIGGRIAGRLSPGGPRVDQVIVYADGHARGRRIEMGMLDRLAVLQAIRAWQSTGVPVEIGSRKDHRRLKRQGDLRL